MATIELDTTLNNCVIALGHDLGFGVVENGKVKADERVLQFPEVLARMGVTIEKKKEPVKKEEGDDGDPDQIRG